MNVFVVNHVERRLILLGVHECHALVTSSNTPQRSDFTLDLTIATQLWINA